MRFYLGSPDIEWLTYAEVPLFYAVASFGKTLPRAATTWALDSGAYTELAKHGTWRATPTEYAARVRELRDAIGMMDFACTQDWVCAPPVMQKTGLTVREHQMNTTMNYLDLLDVAPEVVWMPTLQGWTGEDYLTHVEIYEGLGVDLTALDLVGIGTIASRQEDPEIGRVVRHLAGHGIKLHGFGVKKMGLKLYSDALASADSHAWSFDARFSHRARIDRRHQRGGPALEECRREAEQGLHPQTCADCLRFAMWWRQDVMRIVSERKQHADNDPLFAVDHTYVPTNKGGLDTRQGARKVAAAGKRNKTDDPENPTPERLFDL